MEKIVMPLEFHELKDDKGNSVKLIKDGSLEIYTHEDSEGNVTQDFGNGTKVHGGNNHFDKKAVDKLKKHLKKKGK
jgi:hypothetical protein